MAVTRFFGKYRGTVANNVDPLQQGRLQVRCPAVLGEEQLSWALPSTPYGGPGVGWFAIPPAGANVWVEFEGGDPNNPIWTGCFWGPGEAPALPATPRVKVFKTEGVTLTISDVPEAGGVTIEVSPPIVATLLKISLTGGGIELTNGAASITLGEVGLSFNTSQPRGDQMPGLEPAPVGSVEEYLNSLEPARRSVVEAVRDVVNQALPDGYEEAIAYGMIGWNVPLERYPDTYNGKPLNYVALAAQKRYYSLYLNAVYAGSVAEGELRERWEAAGRRLDMGKSCLRFKRLDDLDLDVLSEVIAATPVDEFIALYERSRASRHRSG